MQSSPASVPNRLSRLEPPEPPNRHCRRHPGELIHIDVKKLGRFDRPGLRVEHCQSGYRHSRAGWEYCHVAIDDTSRVAYVEILDDETGPTCVAFLRRAISWFAALAELPLGIGADPPDFLDPPAAGFGLRTSPLVNLSTRRNTSNRPQTCNLADASIGSVPVWLAAEADCQQPPGSIVVWRSA